MIPCSFSTVYYVNNTKVRRIWQNRGRGMGVARAESAIGVKPMFFLHQILLLTFFPFLPFSSYLYFSFFFLCFFRFFLSFNLTLFRSFSFFFFYYSCLFAIRWGRGGRGVPFLSYSYATASNYPVAVTKSFYVSSRCLFSIIWEN